MRSKRRVPRVDSRLVRAVAQVSCFIVKLRMHHVLSSTGMQTRWLVVDNVETLVINLPVVVHTHSLNWTLTTVISSRTGSSCAKPTVPCSTQVRTSLNNAPLQISWITCRDWRLPQGCSSDAARATATAAWCTCRQCYSSSSTNEKLTHSFANHRH